jgi:tetratricopeptide (TPR) repeat protein
MEHVKVCVAGDGERAIAACSAAIASGRWTGTDLIWAFLDRGMLFAVLKRYDEALADFNRVLTLKSDSGAAYF